MEIRALNGYISCVANKPVGKMICLEALAATGFNDIFSGRRPHRDVLVVW